MWALAGRKDLAAFRGTKPPLSPPSAHPSLGAAAPLTSPPGDSSPLGGEAFGGPPDPGGPGVAGGLPGQGVGCGAQQEAPRSERSLWETGTRCEQSAGDRRVCWSEPRFPGRAAACIPAREPAAENVKVSLESLDVGARAASHPQREAVRGIHTTRGSHGQEGAVVTAAPRLTPRWR